jgi:hypothetical protein
VSSIRNKNKKPSPRPRRAKTPRLALVPGGRNGAPNANGAGRLRDGVVDRARTRVSKGFYDKPTVQRALVETLWKELCDD